MPALQTSAPPKCRAGLVLGRQAQGLAAALVWHLLAPVTFSLIASVKRRHGSRLPAALRACIGQWQVARFRALRKDAWRSRRPVGLKSLRLSRGQPLGLYSRDNACPTNVRARTGRWQLSLCAYRETALQVRLSFAWTLWLKLAIIVPHGDRADRNAGE